MPITQGFLLFFLFKWKLFIQKKKIQDFNKGNSKYIFQTNENIDSEYKLLNKKHGYHLQITLSRSLKKTKFQFYFFNFRLGK